MNPPSPNHSPAPDRPSVHENGAEIDLESEAQLARLTRLASHSLQVPIAVLCLRKAGRLVVQCAIGLPAGLGPEWLAKLAEILDQWVTQSHEPKLLSDARAESLGIAAEQSVALSIAGFAGISLHTESGQVLGSLCLIDDRPREWAETHLQILVDLAETIQGESARCLGVAEVARLNARFSAVLDASTEVAIIATDEHGIITVFNEGAEELLGYSREELIGLKTPVLFHDPQEVEQRARMLSEELGAPVTNFATFVARLETATHDEQQWTYLCKDGSRKRVSLVVTAISDASNQIVGYLGVAKDVTQAVLAEQKLREFASLIEHSGDFIVMLNHEGDVTYLNPAGQSLVGLKELDLSNRLPFDRVLDGPTALLIQNQAIPEALSTGHWTGDGVLRQLETGELIDVDMNLFLIPERCQQGPPDLAMIVRDATERKRSESRILESGERLRAILESSFDALITIDHEGRVLEFNPSAERIFGFKREEVVDRFLFELIVPAQYREAHKRGMAHYFKTGEGPILGRQIEIDAQRADGSIFPVELAIAAIKLDGPPMFTASLRDISERISVERQLRLAKEEAVAASRYKSEFLANMSHEVRTPMSAVLGYADMLLDPNLSLTERDHALQAIRRNGSHLLQLINDILDLSKIEAGKMELEPIPYSPWQIVQEVISSLRVRGDERGIQIETRATGRLPSCALVDPTRVRQILVNLVGNAIKFSKERGRVTIQVDSRPVGVDGKPDIRFMVEDRGIGMTPEQCSRLFMPFHQADSSTTRRFGGTGLGLSITKYLVETMGGEIAVSSEPGRGSRFRVTLPITLCEHSEWVEPGAHAAHYSPAAKAVVGAPPAITLKGRVLLAEDSPDNQRVLVYHLRRFGLDVEVAENGVLAIERTMRGGIDLILMDMQMPELDGYGATSSLRRSGYTRPIIALTAHAMKEDRERCLRTGCTDYLTKPVEADFLGQVLAQYLPSTQTVVASESPAPIAEEQAITSELAGDPEFEPLLRSYVESLAEYANNLHRAADEGDLKRIEHQAHQTKGSGAMYGYPMLTEISALIERAARNDYHPDMIQPLIEWFDQVVTRITFGLATTPNPDSFDDKP